jgi:hypothetical protein
VNSFRDLLVVNVVRIEHVRRVRLKREFFFEPFLAHHRRNRPEEFAPLELHAHALAHSRNRWISEQGSVAECSRTNLGDARAKRDYAACG